MSTRIAVTSKAERWNRIDGDGLVHAKGEDTDDDEVIARVNAGERDLFRILVARYGVLAHRTAILCGAGDDADDVVQEAYASAYRALPRFRPGQPFRPWLLRIVVNHAHNATRSRRRARHLADRAAAWQTADVSGDDPASNALTVERRRELVTALGELREPDREILALRFLLDLSETETATALNRPKGTVKSRTSRALDRLRDVLSSQDVEVGVGDD